MRELWEEIEEEFMKVCLGSFLYIYARRSRVCDEAVGGFQRERKRWNGEGEWGGGEGDWKLKIGYKDLEGWYGGAVMR